MILTNRLFTRSEPSRDAKSIYIFCEGAKREYNYFSFFRGIDSRINIEIYSLDNGENNSPMGLFEIAKKSIIKSKENPNPRYEFINDIDEVWFVIDTDKWEDKITELRGKCENYKNWNISQSNPCFEVWLYYHQFSKKPSFKGDEACKNWKSYLDKKIPGGFDSRKHPIYFEKAIINSEKNHEEIDCIPIIGCTDVFKLSKRIYPLVKDKIIRILQIIN